jgi:hypothetical protein
MKSGVRFVLVACLVTLTGVVAEAHHGWAEFDSVSKVTMEGTVVDFHFTNPHCVVEFKALDDKGQARQWQGEFASPVELTRKGWTAATLQPGTKVTIGGHPAKNGAPAIHVTSIRLADGKVLPVPESN